jgi:hypothetical protein
MDDGQFLHRVAGDSRVDSFTYALRRHFRSLFFIRCLRLHMGVDRRRRGKIVTIAARAVRPREFWLAIDRARQNARDAAGERGTERLTF